MMKQLSYLYQPEVSTAIEHDYIAKRILEKAWRQVYPGGENWWVNNLNIPGPKFRWKSRFLEFHKVDDTFPSRP